MRISVIIPTLNESRLVSAAVSSAKQAGADEIIVADGASSDGTAEVAAALGCQVIHCDPGRSGQQNAGAERAIFWTRKQLESGEREGNERRWDFLGELPRVHREPGLMFVHGSARNPLNEYVFPQDIYNQRKMERIFALVERYCFQGHTHIPGVFTESLNFISPEECDFVYTPEDSKALVNVGSGLCHEHASNSDGGDFAPNLCGKVPI